MKYAFIIHCEKMNFVACLFFLVLRACKNANVLNCNVTQMTDRRPCFFLDHSATLTWNCTSCCQSRQMLANYCEFIFVVTKTGVVSVSRRLLYEQKNTHGTSVCKPLNGTLVVHLPGSSKYILTPNVPMTLSGALGYTKSTIRC